MEKKTLKSSSTNVLNQQIDQHVNKGWIVFGKIKSENGWHSVSIYRPHHVKIIEEMSNNLINVTMAARAAKLVLDKLGVTLEEMYEYNQKQIQGTSET